MLTQLHLPKEPDVLVVDVGLGHIAVGVALLQEGIEILGLHQLVAVRYLTGLRLEIDLCVSVVVQSPLVQHEDVPGFVVVQVLAAAGDQVIHCPDLR